MNIKFIIDPQFCLKQFLDGYDVVIRNEIPCPAKSLTPAQRQFIHDRIKVLQGSMDLNESFENGTLYATIERFELTVPFFNADKNEIIQKQWVGRVNPSVVGPKGVIEAWMKDYDKAEKEAERLYERH